MKLLFISIIVLFLNIPFGYWRANVLKFSFQWILAVHIPVPVIVALRITTHLGFAWFTYVFMVTAFFLGQKIGAIIYEKYTPIWKIKSSCLFMDIKRYIQNK